MSTKVKATKKAPSPYLMDDAAADLIKRVLPVSVDANEDEAAKALIAILNWLDDDSPDVRDHNNFVLRHAIFLNSAACQDAETAFINSAGIHTYE